MSLNRKKCTINEKMMIIEIFIWRVTKSHVAYLIKVGVRSNGMHEKEFR